MEQDLSATSPTKKEAGSPSKPDMPQMQDLDTALGVEPEMTMLNYTADKSVAMDMTLEDTLVETEEEVCTSGDGGDNYDSTYIDQVMMIMMIK